jgi:hypothetical protein
MVVFRDPGSLEGGTAYRPDKGSGKQLDGLESIRERS